MKVLVACNAFRGSIDAFGASRHIARGLQRSLARVEISEIPIADGGPGTVSVLLRHSKGKRIRSRVNDPLGKMVWAEWAILDHSETAVIELAAASGIDLIGKRSPDPFHASSTGTGQLIKEALNSGCRRIVIGLGGSATVDAGAGLLRALGVRFFDRSGRAIKDEPLGLQKLHRIDSSGLDSRLLECEIIVACDAGIPIGTAVRMFGPQKGVLPRQVPLLEKIFTNFFSKVSELTGKTMVDLRYGGASGGIAASLNAFANAKLRSGASVVLDALDFSKHASRADLIITGEGRFDTQTFAGKGPIAVAKEGIKLKVPVLMIAGQVDPAVLRQSLRFFSAVFCAANPAKSVSWWISNPEKQLYFAGYQVGRLLMQGMRM